MPSLPFFLGMWRYHWEMQCRDGCNRRIWKNVSFMTLWDLSKDQTVEELSCGTSEILGMEELSAEAALGVPMAP